MFYPKKLSNLSDLKQEKKRLVKKRNKLNGIGKDGEGQANFNIFRILEGASPITDFLLNRIQKLQAERKKQKTEPGPGQGSVKKQPWLLRLAKEVIGGYARWKLVELTCKGAMYLIKKRKEQKEKPL